MKNNQSLEQNSGITAGFTPLKAGPVRSLLEVSSPRVCSKSTSNGAGRPKAAARPVAPKGGIGVAVPSVFDSEGQASGSDSNEQGRLLTGFTLIELLVAISVLAVTATIALPFLASWYSSTRLGGAQRELISNLRFTQQNAVTTQKNHLMRFHTAQNYYEVIKKDGGEQVLKTVYLPQNVTFDAINLAPLNSEVEFNAAAVPNSTGEINLKNNKNDIKTIEVTPSGFVRGD